MENDIEYLDTPFALLVWVCGEMIYLDKSEMSKEQIKATLEWFEEE